jgi:hypothetical protein
MDRNVFYINDIVYQIVNLLDCPSICKSKYLSKMWWSICKKRIKKLNLECLLRVKPFVSNNFYKDALILNNHNVCMVKSFIILREHAKTEDLKDLRWVILYNSVHKKIIYTNAAFVLDSLKFNVTALYNSIAQHNKEVR